MTDKSQIEILARLSSGGMGEVLLARRVGWAGFEKLIAIKMIRADLVDSKDVRSMFMDEARLVARLDHPTIAQVYDFGELDGSLFLAMEYVPGIGVNRLIKRRGAVPPIVAASIAAEACAGLHAAHDLRDATGRLLNVVHRDVTPQNLILGFDGHVKILDFGIAFMRDREAPETEFGVVKGKPSYMAPEQIRNQPVDRRADVYGVSIVLHEMLTGKRLFPDDSIIATAKAIERGEVPAPSTEVSGVPEALDRIVLRGLERRPEDRFPTAKDMGAALREVIGVEPSQPLAEFVGSSLADEKAEHDRRLQALLDDDPIIEEVDDDEAPTMLNRTSPFGPDGEEAETVFGRLKSTAFEVTFRDAKTRARSKAPVIPAEPDEDAEDSGTPSVIVGPSRGSRIAALVFVLLILGGISVLITSRMLLDP